MSGRTVDEETQRYIAILKIKQARLFELDKQAAGLGPYGVPPQIEMERSSLRDELEMMETAIQSPARAEIGDELGPSGRFIVNHQQTREIKQSLAAMVVKLDRFITDSLEWRSMHRQVVLIIGVAVVLLAIAFAVVVTYVLTKGGV